MPGIGLGSRDIKEVLASPQLAWETHEKCAIIIQWDKFHKRGIHLNCRRGNLNCCLGGQMAFFSYYKLILFHILTYFVALLKKLAVIFPVLMHVLFEKKELRNYLEIDILISKHFLVVWGKETASACFLFTLQKFS